MIGKRIKYWAMNSWNKKTSLAYNMKIHHIVPTKYLDSAYRLFDFKEPWERVNQLLEDFAIKYNYTWQAGFNGRSGGYLVLYTGGIREDGIPYCRPGVGLNENEVPAEVKKAFRKLANDIYSSCMYYIKEVYA